jgi:acyl-CoA dehydrogenase
MEVLAKYGSEHQQKKYLVPLLNGEIRSAFLMTEPGVASSDATNISTTFTPVKDSAGTTIEYVVNGRKWWSSGAMDPRCKITVTMGRVAGSESSSLNNNKHQQHSMMLIELDAPGVTVVRSLSVFGYDDAPHGHAEVVMENVRVPASAMLLGEGRGFEISQGRLGPGRIHHCMRTIGVAERALKAMIQRCLNRTAFGKPLAAMGTIQKDIADSRIELEQARALTYAAAEKIDESQQSSGSTDARLFVAMIKVAVPAMALKVIDRAIQAHGALGVCQDTNLPYMYAQVRTLRIADGPDEVHRRTIALMELKKHASRETVAEIRAKL